MREVRAVDDHERIRPRRDNRVSGLPDAPQDARERARDGADANQARSGVGTDDRSDLGGEDRLGVEDLEAAVDQALRLLGRLDVLHDPAVGAAVVEILCVGDHALERASGGAHPLDRRDFVLE